MSRKIDALIAEHVMGLEVGERTSPGWETYYYTKQCDEPTVKFYSTDIASAWEVMEKTSSKEGTYPQGIEREVDGTWFCTYDSGDDWEIVGGETAPMAICLTALKAKGIEVE